MNKQLLDTITALSHEFGTPECVKGGGGNSSAKDGDRLWIKPSGTVMARLEPASFVAVDRHRLAELYAITPPADSHARETLVKDLLLAAVATGASGRPSVESPVHDAFSATYVVHTHAVLVNGMTCGRTGRAAAADLFPEALWLDYIDPGYTLAMAVRQAIAQYLADHGREPSVVFLKNHGVFVAGNSAGEIRDSYTQMFETLRDVYANAGIATTLSCGPTPADAVIDGLQDQLRAGSDHGDHPAIAASGSFPVTEGALTPDHIVYARSRPFVGVVTSENLRRFRDQHGFAPLILATAEGVFGLGKNPANAALALELARDGALVRQLAAAFGGVEYMDARAVGFIDNWEVEAFRRAVVQR